ncbi:50S ribosomal protein L13 [Candidatus Woesebacteria bacterium RIFCSPHIGHO2_01_FULL_44_21]|uniref:Large ribosomal subunit protein uL13 n=1 Tax=Candidatus Woesebacteria bacterium RIFCSPHIGHO2_01_FULL_44_21 TaxID=1802503 RepID=A0A1F7Z3L8_9BACT|nr:MAG: 50S ribosomal protein L13 [Candidatus Woesebacteria bacterium RIFCSPHIGHO2_01_FULL_44_21]OGM71462.1 MAG: 50S ribosomal protein L13 [Candidatus Woesebacteria bacterium RIFCSPLOWO2_01_FULL_44_24b]
MKTYQIKTKEIKRESHELDAASMPLGRLASRVATLLMGKHKPSYTTHIDMGDSVVVKNAGKLVLTGRKVDQKVYQKHSNYPGGFKEVAVAKLIAERPERVIELAVSRMLPKNRLQSGRMRRLTVER